jgi:hypothetical protein
MGYGYGLPGDVPSMASSIPYASVPSLNPLKLTKGGESKSGDGL